MLKTYMKKNKKVKWLKEHIIDHVMVSAFLKEKKSINQEIFSRLDKSKFIVIGQHIMSWQTGFVIYATNKKLVSII